MSIFFKENKILNINQEEKQKKTNSQTSRINCATQNKCVQQFWDVIYFLAVYWTFILQLVESSAWVKILLASSVTVAVMVQWEREFQKKMLNVISLSFYSITSERSKSGLQKHPSNPSLIPIPPVEEWVVQISPCGSALTSKTCQPENSGFLTKKKRNTIQWVK